jgi:hypothetical protein
MSHVNSYMMVRIKLAYLKNPRVRLAPRGVHLVVLVPQRPVQT